MVKLSKKKILYSLLGLALLGVLGFIALGYFLYGSPWGYRAEAIEAWVIDADTKKPLEGVIVTANWQLEGGWEGHYPMGQLRVMETVTDKTGRFSFPAWGPSRPKKGYLQNSDPLLLLFRSGYKPLAMANHFRERMFREPVRRSDWHGKTIEMTKFVGSLEAYAEDLAHLDISLRFAVHAPENCEWKKIPRMIVALHKQKEVFKKKAVYNHLFAISRIPARECGSPTEFFRGYLQ